MSVIRRISIVPIVFALALTIASGSARAQSASGSSIGGVVKDQSGGALPGVTVEATSDALTEKLRATITDADGGYQLIELPPGVYTVSFSMEGFAPLRREALEIGPNFTATVNVELKIGSIAETVTVSGATPLVDVQSVTQQKVISRMLLDTVPTAKSMLGFAAIMPAVVTPTSAQDVGGSKGETSVRMSIHGARQGDQRLLLDGMKYNTLGTDGTGRGFYINPLVADEIVIDVGTGASAEYSTAGAQVNIIPKSGADRFAATLFGAITSHQLQADNLTPELTSQGLRSVNGIRDIYDANGVLGGPLVHGRAWFTSAHRRWGRTERIANLYRDATPDSWFYTPDDGQPVDSPESNRSHNVRVTAQVSPRNLIAASYEWQQNITYNLTGQLNSGAIAMESNGGFCPQPRLYQGKWTRPQSDHLYFEAGATYLDNLTSGFTAWSCSGQYDHVQISTPGFRYHGTGNRNWAIQNQTNQMFNAKYVVGRHNVKSGIFLMEDTNQSNYNERAPIDTRGLPLAYTFNNGAPTQLTEFVSPTGTTVHLRPELGLYVQDRWTVNRMTINAGVRYDYLRAYVPPTSRPAGPLAPAASFDGVDCVPCWHDINPRVAVAYDLFGDAKSALKASVGRFVGANTIVLAQNFAPVAASVDSTTRSWTDSGNFFPDCDLRNPLANGECGAMANASFGQLQVRNRPDPNWITGWAKRGYNWRASVEYDRQLGSGIAISTGYYRAWFGNATAVDNTLVSPSDYDPYCITAPIDPRLGAISGSQVCGLYDITPTKFGQVDSITTLASNFGRQTEVYNGADINMTMRLHGGGMLSGGWNVGNSVSTTVGLGQTSSRVNNCYVVDSPQQLRNCETQNPYQHRIKINGSYPLPWKLQAAAVFQTLPGPNYGASYTYTTAQAQTTLGRPLAGGTRTLTVDLLPPYSSYVDGRINQLDLRFSKLVRVGQMKLQGNVDLYNVLNASTVLTVNSTFGSTWLQPTQILDARLIKFSMQVDF
jgi:carboxypeptidase family protein